MFAGSAGLSAVGSVLEHVRVGDKEALRLFLKSDVCARCSVTASANAIQLRHRVAAFSLS